VYTFFLGHSVYGSGSMEGLTVGLTAIDGDFKNFSSKPYSNLNS